jgi:DegV family protein with EDD domain
MAIRIVADSTADLDADVASALKISVVPLTIEVDGRVLRDGIDLAPAEFYARLPSLNPSPKTAAPAPGLYTAAFDDALTNGDDVVCITVSSRLSGSFNAAIAGRERAIDPDRITVFDSFSATAAEGNIVVAAAAAALKGAGREQVMAMAESVRDRQKLLVGLETLDYLQRGGRIGRATSFLGGLLNIKPLLTLQDGIVTPSERVRTHSRMLERLSAFAMSYSNPEMVTIAHAALPDDAHDLERKLSASFPNAKISTSWIGAAVGVYTGPGALGVAIVPGETQ